MSWHYWSDFIAYYNLATPIQLREKISWIKVAAASQCNNLAFCNFIRHLITKPYVLDNGCGFVWMMILNRKSCLGESPYSLQKIYPMWQFYCICILILQMWARGWKGLIIVFISAHAPFCLATCTSPSKLLNLLSPLSVNGLLIQDVICSYSWTNSHSFLPFQ